MGRRALYSCITILALVLVTSSTIFSRSSRAGTVALPAATATPRAAPATGRDQPSRIVNEQATTIARLEGESARLQAEIVALKEANAGLQARVAELETALETPPPPPPRPPIYRLLGSWGLGLPVLLAFLATLTLAAVSRRIRRGTGFLS